MAKHFFIICITLTIVACSCDNTTNNSSNNEVKSSENVSKTQQYIPPTAPSIITDINAQYEYLAENFWSKFNFQDTTQIQSKVLENAFINFLYTLSYVRTLECAQQSIMTYMEAASRDSLMLNHVISLGEKYLYDPNSPMRNEELYICVLQHIIESPKTDELNKTRPKHQLEMALKNRVGTVATDFLITTDKNERIKLSQIKSEHIILMFNNPDCPECLRVKQIIESENDLFSNIKIVSVYTDSDLSVWEKTVYPNKWVNGYDKGEIITKNKLYDLKAIPSLYLLNQQHNILLKDAPIETIINYLKSQNSNI
ncbi:MAG: DUF5106 domain-containing protein [Rikenellaceae bacterium]